MGRQWCGVKTGAECKCHCGRCDRFFDRLRMFPMATPGYEELAGRLMRIWDRSKDPGERRPI